MWILLFLALLPCGAQAKSLSWPEAVALARENNPELRAAAASVRAAEAQEGSARAGFLPKISGSLSATRANSVTNNTSLPASTTYAASLSGSQNLFAGLQDAARVRQAEANSGASAAEALIATARISFELKSAFEGLNYSQSYLALAEQIKKRRQENYRLVQLRFESGRENKGSVLLSQAYLAQAGLDHLQATNARRTASANLARALGLDDPQIELKGEVPTTEPGSREDFTRIARSTPDFLRSQAQAASAGEAITIARAGYFPSLDLTGSYGRNDNSFFPSGPDRWQAALTLSVPFFNGGRDYYGARAAAASFESAALKSEDTARATAANLTEAFTSFQEAAEKLKVDQSFRDAATVRAEIARTKYNNGLLTFDDWDTIENDLIARQKTFLQSKRARVIAEAAWEQAQGKGAL